MTLMLHSKHSKRFFRKAILIVLLINCSTIVFAQVYSNKELGKKNAALIDSLKTTEYPYFLPIWGKKVAKRGFNLPYSAGIGINYLWQKSDLVIQNISVGFNNGPMHNVDQVIRFNEAVSEAQAINIRPDIWVLPFLNVYGIFAKSTPSTTVGFGIWVPDSSNNWHEIASYRTKANFTAQSVGFGLTPTIGVGGGWFALDMNFTWNDVSALNEPAFAFVVGPRFGKTFKFKKPEQNIAFWVGGFRLKLASGTNGSVAMSDVLPDPANAQAKIDAGLKKVNESQAQVDSWWNSLTPPQQNNPVNKAKYETANKALTAAGNVLTAADGAISTISNSSVQYSLEKSVKDPWNFIVGSQFQLNKSWMLRFEYGFLGSRQQVIAGLQYRFGL
jgi:hypothetical protein